MSLGLRAQGLGRHSARQSLSYMPKALQACLALPWTPMASSSGPLGLMWGYSLSRRLGEAGLALRPQAFAGVSGFALGSRAFLEGPVELPTGPEP